jgi:hypothetical protein
MTNQFASSIRTDQSIIREAARQLSRRDSRFDFPNLHVLRKRLVER